MARIPEKIRLRNLELLIAEAGSASRLAQLARTSCSYLSQVRRQMKTRKGTPRGIGDDLAAKLEQGMGKPEGWMDIPQRAKPASGETNANPGPDVHRLLPVISWVQAGEWAEIAENFVPDYEPELLPCPVYCSPESFILRVRGSSMEPKFHDGDLIFVDPNAVPGNKKFVVVQLDESHEATFKQLIVEGDRRYLQALNPDWPNRIIEVNESATICGVVVFKGSVV